jgi:hypothetical protein
VTLEFLVFFCLALGATTLTALLPGVIASRFWVGLPLGLAALAAAAFVSAALLDDATAAVILGGVAVLAAALTRIWQPAWSWTAAQLLTTVALASLGYLVYAALQTYAAGLGVGAMAASSLLLLLEISALALSVSYAFEIVDVLGRRRPPRRAVPRDAAEPWVALQLPTYNEPVELVQHTLEALSRVDYPNLLVQVVDNNTKDEALWRPVEALCARLGPRFTFLHLDPWPGYKAGALNEATRRLPPHIEVLGIVDADYDVAPEFLRATVPHFVDPRVAFVQSSQHYRDWEDNAYLRGLFYSFRYFFDLTMPARAHRNAIIFCGTMGLIRRSALEEIGGWNEACITEDAEASLRMLGRGYVGVQILRLHWRELVPLMPHRLRLTMAQRIHYLLGALQWFGDVVTACFTILLIGTALTTALHHELPLRRLTGSVLAVPLAFAATGVVRALWAMRVTTGCTVGDAVRAMRVWFALSWVVTLACVRGLVSSRAEFLRTPKSRDDEGTMRKALRTSRSETALALVAVLAAVAMMVRSPNVAPLLLGALLLFEAGVYSSAPWASIAAERVARTPERLVWSRSSQNTGERPPWRAAAAPALATVLAAGAAAAAVALIAGSPPGQAPPFSGGGAGNLTPIGRFVPQVPGIGGPQPPASGPTPSPAPASPPALSPGSSSPAASARPSPTQRSSPSSAPTGTASPRAPAATASPAGTGTPGTPGTTQQPTRSAPSTASPAPSGTPAATASPGPATPAPTPTP